MERYDLYNDIAQRTQGEIFVGVVGPVRTGKSTFIKKFMDMMVLPVMQNPYKRERMQDEMPQSGAGRMIMTTQPNFVPNEAAEIELEDGASVRVKLVDCVGYLVDGAAGHMDEDMPRMVRTPWFDYDIPFTEAAEIGTRKVISEHSTIGIVVTTDGTFTDIPRANYVPGEERVIQELKELNKPFVVVLNSANPNGEETLLLRDTLEAKYGVPVLLLDVLTMEAEEMERLLKDILFEFPLREVRVNVPDWILALSGEHWLVQGICGAAREAAADMNRMRDCERMIQALRDCEFLEAPSAGQVRLGEGRVELYANPRKELFYQILGDECGYPIEGEYHLVSIIKELVEAKKEYDKVKDALESVRRTGYGLVQPTMDELTLDEPEIVRQGSKYGVRLKAVAPSLHMIRVDIETEISPIMGSESQSEELLNYLLSEFESEPAMIWSTNIFGKSLHDLVKEGLSNKLMRMPEEIQTKMQMTLQRVINEGRGNMLCILF